MGALIALLAGGEGRRLRGSKPAAPLAGRPLICYPLKAALDTGEPVAVVAKQDTELPCGDARVIREPAQPRHPLVGVLTALSATEEDAVVALAADMPFVSAGLIRFLASDPRALVTPEAGGRLHPLPARYSKDLAGPLGAALARGEPLTDTVLELGPARLGPDQLRRFGAAERLLFNVNTNDDLEEAERLIAAG